MRTIRRSPASAWWASTRPTVTLAGRRRSALIVTLNLAVAAIYLVHIGHGIGLGGGRVDLEVYRAGAAVELHGGDLYGQLPRLGNGHQLPFTYPPFAALTQQETACYPARTQGSGHNGHTGTIAPPQTWTRTAPNPRPPQRAGPHIIHGGRPAPSGHVGGGGNGGRPMCRVTPNWSWRGYQRATRQANRPGAGSHRHENVKPNSCC